MHVYKLGPVKVGSSFPVRVMGILNVSPESFFKNSIGNSPKRISELAKKIENEGADFIDIGGMSTAPYSKTLISENEEIKRVVKALKIVKKVTALPISIDTCRAQVAQKAIEEGAEIVNDISGLKFDKKMITVLEKFRPSVILSAFGNYSKTKSHVINTKHLLNQSVKMAISAGIPKNKITCDPAIGFFRKTGTGPFFSKIDDDWVNRDLNLIKNLKKITRFPILISVSNKSFIGKILDIKKPEERIYGSIAAEVWSQHFGANIIRTHNVKETKNALIISEKIKTGFWKGL